MGQVVSRVASAWEQSLAIARARAYEQHAFTRRVVDKKSRATINGSEPKNLYIGRSESKALESIMRDNARYITNPDPSQNPRTMFLGLEVFRVDTETHMEVM